MLPTSPDDVSGGRSAEVNVSGCDGPLDAQPCADVIMRASFAVDAYVLVMQEWQPYL